MRGNRVRWRALGFVLGALLVMFAWPVQCTAMPTFLLLPPKDTNKTCDPGQSDKNVTLLDVKSVKTFDDPSVVTHVSGGMVDFNFKLIRSSLNKSDKIGLNGSDVQMGSPVFDVVPSQTTGEGSLSINVTTERRSSSERKRLFLEMVVTSRRSSASKKEEAEEETRVKILSRTDRSVPSIRMSDRVGVPRLRNAGSRRLSVNSSSGSGVIKLVNNTNALLQGNASSRTKSGSNLDRNERSANLSHITGGSARKIQLYIKNRYLQILPDGSINGTQDELSDYTILQRTSVDIGKIKIQSVATCLFLCMDACGNVFASRDFADDCIFNEAMELHHYNTYSSSKHSNARRILYLALNRHGQPRKIQIPVTRSLGKLSTYTNALTHTVEERISDQLLAKLFGQNHVKHGLKQLCDSSQVHLKTLTESVLKPRPKCLAGEKKKAQQGLPPANLRKILKKQKNKQKKGGGCREDEGGEQLDVDCLKPSPMQVLGGKRKPFKQSKCVSSSEESNCQGGPKKQKPLRKGGSQPAPNPVQNRHSSNNNKLTKKRRLGMRTTTASPVTTTETEDDQDSEDETATSTEIADDLVDESSISPAQNFNRLTSSLVDDDENEFD